MPNQSPAGEQPLLPRQSAVIDVLTARNLRNCRGVQLGFDCRPPTPGMATRFLKQRRDLQGLLRPSLPLSTASGH